MSEQEKPSGYGMTLHIPHCPNCGGRAMFVGSAYRPIVLLGEAPEVDSCDYPFTGKITCDDCMMSTGDMPGFDAVDMWNKMVLQLRRRSDEGSEKIGEQG